MPCGYKRICLPKPGPGGAYKSASILGTAIRELSKKRRLVLGEDISIFSMQFAETQGIFHLSVQFKPERHSIIKISDPVLLMEGLHNRLDNRQADSISAILSCMRFVHFIELVP